MSAGVVSEVRTEFFPESHCDDGLTHWPFPAHLRSRSRWSARLARMYTRPGICPPSLAPEAGLLLQSLLLVSQPRTVVEIGSLRGVSAVWLAAGLAMLGHTPEGEPRRMHCIDLFGPPGPRRALDALRAHGRRLRMGFDVYAAGIGQSVSVYAGDSASVIERLRRRGSLKGSANAGRAIDLAYVDGDHSFEGVLRDVRAIEPSLAPGSMVILHDVFPERCGCEGPRQLLDRRRELLGDRFECCDLYTMPCNFGFSLLRLKGPPAGPAGDALPAPAAGLLLFSLLVNARPRSIAVVGPAPGEILGAVMAAAAAVAASTRPGEPGVSVHAAATDGGPSSANPGSIGWIDPRTLPPGRADPVRHEAVESMLAALGEGPALDVLIWQIGDASGELPRFAEALARLRAGGYAVLLGSLERRNDGLRAELGCAGVDFCDLGGLLLGRKRIRSQE